MLIAVYWTWLLCTDITRLPPSPPAQAAVCHMALLSSDKNLLLSDHNSWKCSALKSLSCWDSSWATTQSTSTQNEWVLWRQLMVGLDAGFMFGVNSELDCGHFSWGKHCVEESKRFKSDTTTVLLTIRIALGLWVIIYLFIYLSQDRGRKKMKENIPYPSFSFTSLQFMKPLEFKNCNITNNWPIALSASSTMPQLNQHLEFYV